MRNRGALLAGVALALCYVAAASLTGALSARRVRPLFDGFTPPPPYRWIKPPADVGGSDEQPAAAHASVRFTGRASTATSVATSDGQALVTLDAGAVPLGTANSTTTITLTPIDGTRLGVLPVGLEPTSNAYRVEIRSQPTRVDVAALRGLGAITLTAARHSPTLLHSRDGRVWRVLRSRALDDEFPAVTGVFRETGYYLLAAPPVSPHSGGGPLVADSIVIGAFVLIVVGFIARSRRTCVTGRTAS